MVRHAPLTVKEFAGFTTSQLAAENLGKKATGLPAFVWVAGLGLIGERAS
jgi:hypothetical protein